MVTGGRGVTIRVVLLAGVAATALAYLVLRIWIGQGGAMPPATWGALIVLVFMACGVFFAGLPVRRFLRGQAKKPLNPIRAMRTVVLAQASALTGAVVTGWYLAQALVLLPNFDSEYAARLVLGQTWRTATPEQRKRFVDAFYHSLLRNYGAALVNFTADRFVILPFKGDPGDTQATVRTEVKKDTGEKVPVNFSLHQTPQGWKAWDVVIEGISYVKSFRTDFAAEIQQKGLDEVINRLEKEGTVRAGGVSGAGTSR